MIRDDPLLGSRILLVDDEEPLVLLLEEILREGGYTTIRHVTDSRHALPVFMEFAPDLVVLDLGMPHLDGFTVLRQLVSRVSEDTFLPVVIVTADLTLESRRRALTTGAKDFLTKPFNVGEVLLRARNLLETRWLYVELRRQNQLLEERIRERTGEVEEARLDMLDRLVRVSEFREDDTARHAQRVGHVSGLLAQVIGLPTAEADLLPQAALLHDVGKIGIPDAILLKAGPLTEEEFEVMRTHTTIGARILLGSRSRLLQLAEEVALTHHERWDGRGYARLGGETIPLAGRIVALADTLDVLTHDRPYRRAHPLDEALAEIRAENGRQFDPRVVEALLDLSRTGRLEGLETPPG
jgi:putative two-component system response regulator